MNNRGWLDEEILSLSLSLSLRWKFDKFLWWNKILIFLIVIEKKFSEKSFFTTTKKFRKDISLEVVEDFHWFTIYFDWKKIIEKWISRFRLEKSGSSSGWKIARNLRKFFSRPNLWKLDICFQKWMIGIF